MNLYIQGHVKISNKKHPVVWSSVKNVLNLLLFFFVSKKTLTVLLECTCLLLCKYLVNILWWKKCVSLQVFSVIYKIIKEMQIFLERTFMFSCFGATPHLTEQFFIDFIELLPNANKSLASSYFVSPHHCHYKKL